MDTPAKNSELTMLELSSVPLEQWAARMIKTLRKQQSTLVDAGFEKAGLIARLELQNESLNKQIHDLQIERNQLADALNVLLGKSTENMKAHAQLGESLGRIVAASIDESDKEI